MTYDDDAVDRMLRGLPAPGVPPEVRERHLEQLREAMGASPRLPAPPTSDIPGLEPLDHEPVPVTATRRTLRRRQRAHGTRRPPTRRRRVVLSVVTAAAVLVSGTAFATIAWQRANDRSKVHCYPKITTDFGNRSLGGDALSIDSDTVANAIPICKSEWEQGYLTSTPPYIDNGTPVPATAPPLIACVLPSDVVGVFPARNGETCESLGLPNSNG